MIIGIAVGCVIATFFVPRCETDCPEPIEKTCGEVVDEICPGSAHDYSRTQSEECRSREFRLCIEAAAAPTIETCREECAEIVRDLSRANDDLWERWLACAESEEASL